MPICSKVCPIELSPRKKAGLPLLRSTTQRVEKIEPPRLVVSSEDAVTSHPLDGDSDLQVKCLLPDEQQFDFAVNTMVYQPGASLSMVEMHVMEHGLIMPKVAASTGLAIRGTGHRGRFHLDGAVVPQWFGAIGKCPQSI